MFTVTYCDCVHWNGSAGMFTTMATPTFVYRTEESVSVDRNERKMNNGVTSSPPEDDLAARQVWFVPRRVMCAIFWLSNVLLFTGIILLVTSKHKGL